MWSKSSCHQLRGAAAVFSFSSVILILLYGFNLKIKKGAWHAFFLDRYTDFFAEFFRAFIHNSGVVLGGNVDMRRGFSHGTINDFISRHNTDAAGLRYILGNTYKNVDHAFCMRQRILCEVPFLCRGYNASGAQ